MARTLYAMSKELTHLERTETQLREAVKTADRAIDAQRAEDRLRAFLDLKYARMEELRKKLYGVPTGTRS